MASLCICYHVLGMHGAPALRRIASFSKSLGLLIWNARRNHRCLSSCEDVKWSNSLDSCKELEELLNSLNGQPVEGLYRTYVHLLQGCTKLKALTLGKRVHEHISRNGYEHSRVLDNHIVTMYGKCGDVEEAQKMFDRMLDRNEVSWTVLIAAYAQRGNNKEALQLFRRMQLDGLQANYVTFLTVLSACSTLADGKLLHSQILSSGLESELVVGNALIDMYGKCRSLEDAWSVFKRIPERSVVSWNTMIGACVEHEYDEFAQRLFHEMQLEGFRPDWVSLVAVLSACSEPNALKEGSFVHFCAAESGLLAEVPVNNALVTMYGKCGSLENARRTFEQAPRRTVISWTAIIAAYAMHGNRDAMKLLQWMQLDGVKPNNITFVALLNGFGRPEVLAEARLVHSLITESGYGSASIMGNALLSMYSKCSSLEDVEAVFDKVLQRNVISWTSMIATYAQHGYSKEAFELLRKMLHEGVKPNSITLITVLSACNSPEALAEGKLMHNLIAGSGLEPDVVVATAVIDMYGKCGSLENAQRLFDSMQQKDVILWTSMISAHAQNGHSHESAQVLHQMQLEGKKATGIAFASVLNAISSSEALPEAYVQHGHNREAIRVFQRMQLEGGKPSNITFITVLPAYAGLGELAEGQKIHAWIKESGLEADTSVGNGLIDMYGKCGSVEDAQAIFDRMQKREVVTWTSLITAYAQQGHDDLALELCEKMQLDAMRPNKVCLVAALGACASLSAVAKGKLIHAHLIESGLEGDVVVGNALVNFYGKCGIMEASRQVFSKILHKDVVSWNTHIAAFAQHGHGDVALKLFRFMQQDGLNPDHVTFVSTLTGCSHAGFVEEGCKLFASIDREHQVKPTGAHYACMIDLLGRAGQLAEAWKFIKKMPVQPHATSWRSFLAACKSHGDLAFGKLAAERVLELDPEHSAAYVVLSSVYAAGNIDATSS